MISRSEKLLLFLTVLFLPTQLGRHFWPSFSFVYSLPIDYLSPTLYLWDILVIALLVIFLLSGKHINRTAINLFYFFILTQSLSLLFVRDPQTIGIGFVRLEQYLLAGLFGVYIASTDFKRIIFWALAISVIGESFLAIGQFIKNKDLGFWILGERSFTISTPGIAKFDFYGRQLLRPYATFPHPNVLAAFMLLAILIINSTLSLRGRSRATVASLLGMTMGFLGGMVMLLTVSRVAIMAGLIAAMVLLKKKGRLLILLALLLLLPILYARFFSLLNFDNLTLIRREQLSEVAIQMWFKSPTSEQSEESRFLRSRVLIFGIGLNNFIPAGADLLLVGTSRFLQPAHNIFLLALSETGLVGLIGLLVLFGYPLAKLNPKPYTLNPILICWMVVIFLGMFDHYFLTLPQGYRLLFLIWGLSFGMLK